MPVGVMDEEQRQQFERELEMNLAMSVPGVGRFRINIFRQRNEVSMVCRNIKLGIPLFEDLKLPEILLKVVMEKRGLVLFVGGTGSGKSTSLAALIDHRNRNSSGHIITIEDPVEYVHRHKKSIINQREVGVDTRSFQAALKNTLRQAPDVILIGEIREPRDHGACAGLRRYRAPWRFPPCTPTTPTRRSTASSTSSPRSVGRSCSTTWVTTSKRLSPSAWSRPRMASAVRRWRCCWARRPSATSSSRGEFDLIKEVMDKSRNLGMQTFDQALIELAKEGVISDDEAIKNADSANNVRLKLKLYRDDPANAALQPAAAAPVAGAAPAAPAPAKAEPSSWGLELKLEAIEEEEPAPEDPGRPGI